MNTEFGFKELYQVFLRANSPMKIGDRDISPGEVVAAFDKILISNFDEITKITTAHGGLDDRDFIWWESTKKVNITFSQGIFSKTQFSLMNNSKLFDLEKETIYIPSREEKESNENGIIKVDHDISTLLTYFIYDKTTGARITNFTLNDTDEFKIESAFKEVIVDYYYEYSNGSMLLRIGQKVSDEGQFLLEGKTRVKDDITGQTKTGIIIIPKLQLVSDLSMRLGQDAIPVIGRLDAVACPVGFKGAKKVVDILLLDDDIDSDIQ